MTAGSVTTNNATSPASSRRDRPNTRRFYLTASPTYLISCVRLNSAWLTIGAPMLPRREKDAAPRGAEEAGRQHRIDPLLDVPETENHAEENQSHRSAAQILLEPAQDETALDLLANAAGNHHDERERQRVPRRLQHVFERVVGDVVQLRRKREDQREHDENENKKDGQENHAQKRFPQDRSRAEQQSPRRLAMRTDEQEDQSDDQDGIEQRDGEDE